MRFEESIDIDVGQQRVWDVLTDIEAWPRHIETVDVAERSHPHRWRQGSLLPPATNAVSGRANVIDRALVKGPDRIAILPGEYRFDGALVVGRIVVSGDISKMR